ncbi:MAG: LPS export ABC transporter ATP-binding protein [Planctomycetota bacterium]
MYILSAQGLVKSYSRRRVVDGVSLDIAPGEVVGLLGPNGAGKSTSFKMMCGLVKPDQGKVTLQGVDVTTWPLHRRSREGGMGYLPQQSSVFGKLSAQDNLKGMMQLLGFSWKEQRTRTEELLEQFKLTHVRRNRADNLSGGEKRRLEIARCLVANPKIIMLDEPFAGIDPITVQSVQVDIRELSDSGIAVLITDHAAREILQITDRTYVVSEGRILTSGTPAEIVTHPEVKRKYLGDIELVSQSSSAVAPNARAATSNRIDAPATTIPKSVSDDESPAVLSMTGLPDDSAKPTTGPTDSEPATGEAPRIKFSKPRRNRKVVAPFRSTDLD